MLVVPLFNVVGGIWSAEGCLSCFAGATPVLGCGVALVVDLL